MGLGKRGQSEVLGTALLLGITVISVALVVSVAGSALDGTRETTDVESAENAMSQLDAQAALVALGRTESQSIDMGRARAGSYRVDEDAGWIKITHRNHNASSGADETLYNDSLGAIVYERGATEIAYQGGGVWRKGPSGGSVLVSPPEFHYRGETLTIPIIQVQSPNAGGGASGAVTVRLQRNYSSKRIFPDTTTYQGTPKTYANPIQNGSIRVKVHSEYYQAWGSFFRSRTAGNVSVHDSNKTAIVDLVVPAIQGEFEMPLDGDSIKLRGIEGHAVSDLNVTLAPDDSDSANFANLKWSLYAEDGSEKLELHIRSGENMKCTSTSDTNGSVKATIYYTNGSGTYQGWTKENAFPVVCNDIDDDDDPEARVIANWSKPTNFNYSSLSKSDLLYFNPSGTLAESVTFDQHPADTADSPTYSSGSAAPINYTVSHYAAFFGPTLELTVTDSGGGGGTVNEDDSSGSVHFMGGDSFVTYVHATENNLNVTVTT